jgi:hypothetical protein
MNEVLMMIVVGAVVFALAAGNDPKFGRWLAAVIFARALAVEASRETYGVARRSGIELRPILRGESLAWQPDSGHTAEK